MSAKHIKVVDLLNSGRHANISDYSISFAKFSQDEGLILATVIKNINAKQRAGAFYNVRIKYEPVGPLTTTSQVKVSCSCPDFLTSWSYVLAHHNGLFNQQYASLTNEFSYAIITPPKHRNPSQRIGACKHVLLVLQEALKNQ